MSSSAKPAILAVGLPLSMGPQGPIKVAWSDTPISIPEELEKVNKIMAERGYSLYETLEPNDVRGPVTAKLQSRHWDVLVVGGGLKTIPEMVGALEDLVNTAKEVSPSTRVMFVSKGPMSLLETVERFEAIQSKP